MKIRFTEDDDLDTMDLAKAMSLVAEEMTQPNQGEKEQEMETPEGEVKKKVKRKIVKKTTAKKKVAAKKTAKRAAPVKQDGMIDLSDLAKELKLEPPILRRRIRAMDGLGKKKTHRYVWAKGDATLKKIRENIRAAD